MLRDWNVGKFSHYAVPLKTESNASKSPAWLAKLYEPDEAVLATVPTKHELKKTVGLVRFTSGGVDERKVQLEQEWPALEEEKARAEESSDDDDEWEDEDAEEDEQDVDEDDEDDEMEDDEDVEDDESEDESEEEELPAPTSSKRKRGPNTPLPAPPSKKVAFAESKKGSAQSKPTKAPPAPSSILKKAPAKVAKPTAAPVKPKVANAASAKKVKEAANGGVEAYDFSKFF